MADTDALVAKIIDGLKDNARINDVSETAGWDAEQAMDTYLTDDEIQGLDADEYAAVRNAIAAFLTA